MSKVNDKDKKGKNTRPEVKKGVADISSINPRLLQKKRTFAPTDFSATHYVERIVAGDRIWLSKAITLIESKQPAHQSLARDIIAQSMPYSGNSIRIGITGAPGAGKSTFIESFGQYIIAQGKKVAVLAIDPSSQVSKGSILGDKTRMKQLSNAPQAFIRPSPAGDSLGGVARASRETIILCEAAGFGVILLETVGVGQSEIAVHSMTDLFLLLLLPGAGDELQGIKRGVVEMADLLFVNKADENRLTLAKRTQQAYRNALHLYPPKASGWSPKVLIGSALAGEGISKVWETILEFEAQQTKNNIWQTKRQAQARYWLEESILQQLKSRFYEHSSIKAHYDMIEQKVVAGEIAPFAGAMKLLDLIKNS